MSFSIEDKHRIVFALGFCGSVLKVGSVNYHSVINDRLNDVAEFTESEAMRLVGKIEETKTKLEDSVSKNNVKRIDDIELDSGEGISLTKQELSRLKDELASILDIPYKKKGINGIVWA